MLFSRFLQEIQTNNLIKEGNKVIAAVSGGADSMCLLHLLHRLQKVLDFSLVCAHVNHGLRAEAKDDAAFVAASCSLWGIPFKLHEADVDLKAKEEGISIELAGREIRYAFFASLKADIVMTAHNKNDNAESMLLHFIRGCGMEGLCGIKKRREDGVCRPLLIFSRAEIEAYLLEHQVRWREDSTNQETVYTRNKIRQEIIPKIEEINPAFLDTATQMIEILKEENVFLQKAVKTDGIVFKEKNQTMLSVKELEKLPIALQRRIVYTVSDNFTDIMQILSLLHAPNGTRISLSGGKIAEKEYDFLSVYKKESKSLQPIPLPNEGTVTFGNYKITVGKSGIALPRKSYQIRTRQNGDFFYPEGMTGKKKLKDYFIDMKIPKRIREQIPLLVCEEKIAAVGNLRRSRFFVPNEHDTIFVLIEPIENV